MGRKKENRIYSMFEYNEETKKSKCLMEGCEQYIKGNHGANLLRHFFTQHRRKYDEIININSQRQQPTHSQKVQSVMEHCTNLVTIHGRPFSIVEDEAFKEILKMIPGCNNRDLQAINVRNIKENIRKRAHEVRLEISKELKNGLFALKVDVASVKLRRFLGLNVQYILDGKIVLRNLGVVELHDRNTADYLRENVGISLSRFFIELKQLLTITTDNGANMLSMVNRVNESINDPVDETIHEAIEVSTFDNESAAVNDEDHIENFELDVDEDNAVGRRVASIRCAAHCLQLAVKAACCDMQDLLEQCRQVVRTLRTPNMSIKLKEQKLPQAVIDTATRWDSTADMLESLQNLKEFCISNLNVPADFWPLLEKYLNILQPCRFLSKILQKEQLTFGDFYISWMRCRHQVAQIDDAFARRLESCLMEREAMLFENEYFLAAIYLDPRVNSILSNEQATNARVQLTNIFKRTVELNQVNQQEESPQPGTSSQDRQVLSNMTNFDNYLRQQFANVRRPVVSHEFSLERELQFKLVEFLQEPVLPSDSNILDYWERKKITDPYLYNLAKVVLATPPTSVSVERLFSSLKFVLNNLRMSLNDSIIEDVMLIRNNDLYSK